MDINFDKENSKMLTEQQIQSINSVSSNPINTIGNLFKIDYPEIYKEVAELKQFVKNEIVTQNQEYTSEFTNIAISMRGKSNDSFTETISLQQSKTNQLAAAINQVLDFIQASTKEMEQLDRQLSEKIVVEEEV